MIDEVGWSSFEPQSLVVLVKLVVCTRSSLEPQSFSASVAPRGGQCCVHASLYKGQDCRTCSGVCEPVSHGQSTVCVTD